MESSENEILIKEIARSLKAMDYSMMSINGREKKYMDIVLFFYYYSRYASDEQSEEFAGNLFEKVLSSPNIGRNFFYSTGLAGIGSNLLLLVKEGFVEFDSDDVFLQIDDLITKIAKKYIRYDYSFSTGLTGLCHYILERKLYSDVIHAVLNRLISSFSTLNFQRSPISPMFLYPSEVLEDVVLFAFLIEKENLFPEQVLKLRSCIETFKQNNKIFQSNCPEYGIIQQIRKARIENNKQEIMS